jgi:hypothetical protein
MPNGWDILNAALRFYGEPYSTAAGRCSPTSGYKDCSGLVSAALNANGLYGGCGNSTGLEIWAVNNGGHYVSRDFALSNAGVGLTKWGYDAQGHIKLSSGRGNSLGTPSDERHGVGWERFDARGVNRYFTFPGVNYGGGAPPPPPPPKPIDRNNTMFAVETGQGTVWVYDGVRITPAQALKLAADGVAHLSTPEIAFARGRIGQNPDTAENDRANAAFYTFGHAADTADDALAKAKEAVLYAAQANTRVKLILDHFGISE